MVLQVGLLAESSVADMALEGPRPSVDVRVRLQIARGGEGLGAHGALVGLLLARREKKSNETFKNGQLGCPDDDDKQDLSSFSSSP